MDASRRGLDATAIIAVVTLCLLWGLSQVAIRVANAGVGPIFQGATRSAISATLVAMWAWSRGLPLIHRDRTLLHGMAIGLMFGTEFFFLYLGLSYTTASHGVLFLYTAPFFVALGAHWLLPNEPLTFRRLAGLLLAFAGILVTFADNLGRPTGPQILGDLYCLIAGFLWAATSLYLKGVVRSSMTPPQMLFYQLGFSAIQLSLMSLAWELHPIVALTPLVLASIAYQGIIVAFASYLVWFWLIREYPVSNVTSFTFLTPIFGVILGGLLLAEPISAKVMVGAGLVSGGMLLVNWPGR